MINGRAAKLQDPAYWQMVLDGFRQTPTGNWLGRVELEEGEDVNVVDLELVRPTLGGTPPSDVWLLNIKPGSEVAVTDKQDRTNFMVLRFSVVDVDTKNRTALLYILDKDRSNAQPFGEVEASRFSARFSKGEVIEPKQEEEND